MEEHKKQVRSIINGAPVASPVRRSVDPTNTRPSGATPAGNTRVARTTSPMGSRSVINGAKTTARIVTPSNKPTAKTAPAPVATSQSHANQGVAHSLNSTSKPVQARPSNVSGSTASSTKQEGKSTTKKNNKKTGLWLGVCGGLFAVAVIVAVVAILSNNNNGEQGGSADGTSTNTNNAIVDGDSEEVKQITQDTMARYAEVNVEGYKDIEDEDASGKAVIVTVKNTSQETVSLAITIGAYDSDGNLLETSSVYAEGIGPEQTNRFNTFVFTNLTPEQLSTAEYKVYTANTYETPAVEGGDEIVNVSEETAQSAEVNAQENTEGNE